MLADHHYLERLSAAATLVIAMTIAALLPAQAADTVTADSAPQRAFIIPHTHWEGAVFKTREEYLDIGLPNIEKALYLLKKYPDYRFTLDQMCYVRPFLERYPSEEADFREFLKEGRLQIVGGTDTMHDNNMPSGESIVRQFLLAKTFFQDRLGYNVTTGWALDTFGHNAQMPQILKLAGMKSYWFMRGVRDLGTPSEFLWQGLDGSRIPAFWLPIGYGALEPIPGTDYEFSQLLRTRFKDLTHFDPSNNQVLLSGSDVSEPSEALAALLPQFNRVNPSLQAQLATPADFEAVVASRNDQPVVRGELNPVGQGIYSARIELKQAMRSVEGLLTDAEKLSVIDALLGGHPNPQAIEEAWEPVLFSEEHDPAAGSVVDKVYAEELRDYARAQQGAGDEVRRDSDDILAHIDTQGDGVPVVVFNTLAWPRSDIAEVDVSFDLPSVHAFSLLDPTGKPVAFQFVSALHNADGGIHQARITFIARDLPGMGYTVYHAVPNGPDPRSPTPQFEDFYHPSNSTYRDRDMMDNDLYRASFDLKGGELSSLILKKNDWEVLVGSGNTVAREYDGGDFWELYGPLTGGIVAPQRPIGLPRPALTQWSQDNVGVGIISQGPVFDEYRNEGLDSTASDPERPFGKNEFATRVRIYHGLSRIDIRTSLTNQEEFVRYRVLFPTSIKKGTLTEEIPFGAVERSQSQEYPAQNWIDYGDGKKGLLLLNRGIPGNNVADGTMMLSLMRSTRMVGYPLVGGNEAGVGSDTALGIGKRYVLEYALIPHTGDWRAAQAWRALSRIAGVLMSVQGYAISVYGYTDNVGTAEYNLKLSERRAQAVHDYLVQSGLDPKIITTKGYGKSDPRVPGDNTAAHATNRRVEIGIVDATLRMEGPAN